MKEPKTNGPPGDGDFANDLVDDPAASTAVDDDDVVDLVIPTPPALAKQIREITRHMGISPEELLYKVMREWVEKHGIAPGIAMH